MSEAAGLTPQPFSPDEIAPHAHHWLIARQNGPASEGVCKGCGERRDFVNGFTRTYAQPRFGRLGRQTKPEA